MFGVFKIMVFFSLWVFLFRLTISVQCFLLTQVNIRHFNYKNYIKNIWDVWDKVVCARTRETWTH